MENSRRYLLKQDAEQVISAAKSNITEAEYDAEGNLTKVRTGLNSWQHVFSNRLPRCKY